ncbi:C1 family peptidase [Paenimyroides baculatum]|uniref:Aminopeptidase n=1 Tax=Paenimyroides baculatum TaxID=2608000 RepID=A0A5M6CVW9_9FLAO|nr:C1 family peptidase [Paenimyroides baculatum]KAA5538142.1 aminopeptidase [Paenimyroides baculatum]
MFRLKLKPLFAAVLIALAATSNVSAQDDLMNKVKANQSANSKDHFTFTDVINLENTSIKDQGSSGTCWSYSGNSFIESEMIRMGKKPVELAQIFTARNAYVEKGKMYVKMHGAVTLGEGGAFHDVMNMYKKYGTVPRSAYTGLQEGQTRNNFSEMSKMSESVLASVIKNDKLSENWVKAYTSVIDTYLGEAPTEFTYEGKKYTPKTFADQVVGVKAEDYVEISSLKEYPYYTKFTLLVPDNWSFDQVYNVKMDELVETVDNALKNGYTVAWAGDVSEKGFSWKNGVAFVPEIDFAQMTTEQKAEMFNGPKAEKKVTEDERQKAFDNYETTDDHGMHITGVAKDQNGKEYYIVKNSWGLSNDYKGYMYMTKEFMKYKATGIMLHKNAVPKAIAKKLAI